MMTAKKDYVTIVVNDEENDESCLSSASNSTTITNQESAVEGSGRKNGSLVEQSTQTCDLMPTSQLLTSLIPDDLLEGMKRDAPWILNIYNSIDRRFKELDEKVDVNMQQTSTNTDDIASEHQYLHCNCLLIHNLYDMPSNKKGEQFSSYIANKLNVLLPNLCWMRRKI